MKEPARRAGFTLVELVVVIAILAILTALAVPRLARRGDFEPATFVEELAAAARYAQKVAVASGCPVQFTLTGAGYALHQPDAVPVFGGCASNFNRPLRHPNGGGPFAGSFPQGLAVTASVPLPAAVVYDSQGNVPLATSWSVSVGMRELRIHARSGYVETR